MEKDELSKLVMKALEDEKFKWRTLKGIATQLSVNENGIEAVIEDNQDTVVQSSIPSRSGKKLYSTREHYRRVSSGFDRFLGGLKGRIP